MNKHIEIPDTYQKNLHRAVEILKGGGCTDVFLFGSLANGNFNDKSDIDIAIRGCPKGKFFQLLGRLLLELDYPVDLVNLDRQEAFAFYLEKEGELLKIV